MEEIIFISVEELVTLEYEKFGELAKFDKEHPLHRFYDYIVQFFGGMREDVARFFCEAENVKQMAAVIDSGQDAGLKNEWYRRMVRLLQCNAEADWYRLFLIKQDKPQGYIQYFFNQLAGYAELGVPVSQVRDLFAECSSAYLLEYRIRNAKNFEPVAGSEVINQQYQEEEKEAVSDNQDKDFLMDFKEILEPILAGQNQIQNMLQAFLERDTAELSRARIEEVKELEVNTDEESPTEEHPQNEPDEMPGKLIPQKDLEMDKEEGAEQSRNKEKYKENAFQFAKLFQQIRIKRKSVQLRKMDHTQQLQELISRMNKEGFSMEDMKVVRNLIDKEVSLEFLYTIISEERNAVRKLKQMYEFITYRQEAAIES